MDKESYYIRLERKIIIGMILNDTFLKIAHPLIESKYLMGGDESRILVNWVYDYYLKRGAAPKERIQQIYEKQLSAGKINEDLGDNIESVLESLSDQAGEMDETHIKDLSDDLEDYANYCKAKLVIEDSQDLLDTGEVEEAKGLLTNFKPIEIIKVSAKPLLQTDEDLERVFKQAEKPLIYFPGDIGRLLNPHMYRQGFFIFLAQNKGGKALRNDKSPVLTNKGWKDISQMKINDTIYNKNGKKRKVTGVFPQGKKQCYRFIFNDGTFIDSDKDHIWTLQTYYQRYQKMNRGKSNKQYQKWIDMSTKDIAKKYGCGKIKNGSHRPIFPRNGIINFTKKKVNIDPYTLGALLGDGGFTHDYVGFTTDDYCTIEFIEKAGYFLNHPDSQPARLVLFLKHPLNSDVLIG